MKITVTQSHIDNGRRVNCERCPIALALTDAGFAGVSVGHKVFRPNGDRGPLYKLPRAAQVFIGNFDTGVAGQPFSFSIGAVIPGA